MTKTQRIVTDQLSFGDMLELTDSEVALWTDVAERTEQLLSMAPGWWSNGMRVGWSRCFRDSLATGLLTEVNSDRKGAAK